MSGSIAPCDTILAPESSGTVSPGVIGLLLPVDWRRVEDNAEFVCSLVTIMERMLWDMLASVDRNILHPIQVSLKKEGNIYLCL
jgi:hypothetical protein